MLQELSFPSKRRRASGESNAQGRRRDKKRNLSRSARERKLQQRDRNKKRPLGFPRQQVSLVAVFFIAALTTPPVSALRGIPALTASRASRCDRWTSDGKQQQGPCALSMSLSHQEEPPTSMWKKRHAKSVYEGIRGRSASIAQKTTTPSSVETSITGSNKTLGWKQRILSLSTLVKDAQEEQYEEEELGRIFENGNSDMVQVNGFSSSNFFDSANTPKNGGAGPKVNSALLSQLQPLTAPNSLTLPSQLDGVDQPSPQERPKRRKRTHRVYAARTIAGLIAALAEEALNLHVEVHTQHHTPLWRKTIDTIHVSFSKLGFKPLRISGVEVLSKTMKEWEHGLSWQEKREYTKNLQMEIDVNSSGMSVGNLFEFNEASVIGNEAQGKQSVTAEEAFRQMDTDNSGALDQEELVAALNMAFSDHQEISGVERGQLLESPERMNGAALPSLSAFPVRMGSTSVLQPSWGATRTDAILGRLAARLMQLYDVNGDGVVDRSEYLTMVQDMAALRRSKRRRHLMQLRRKNRRQDIRKMLASWLWNLITGKSNGVERSVNGSGQTAESNCDGTLEVLEIDDVSVVNQTAEKLDAEREVIIEHSVPVTIPRHDPILVGSHAGEGSILIENLKLDLRRLVFGAVPVVKNLVPGGPLILEPFTVTATGSFKKDDIVESFLLQAGLKRLVARALRRRVRSFRDIVDGAHFFGRTWTMASKEAPQVDLPEISNVEFDAQDRMIITGRARLRTSLGAPQIENAFKLRTKFGTRENGRMIRLEEPELALVLECPRAWERNIVMACQRFGIPVPKRPEPLYSYFPLVSPVKVTDKDGFDLGDDNCIKHIEIKNGALRFELSSVLRPGRFLGNHYLAFTVPNRTFIITLDRVLEGIRAARRNKREVRHTANEAAAANSLSAGSSQLSGEALSARGTRWDGDHLRFAEPENKQARLSFSTTAKPSKESFFSRFVRGYLGASSTSAEEREEEWNERLTAALSEWFGRQEVRRRKGTDEENDYNENFDMEADDIDEDELAMETIGPNGSN